MSRLLLILLLCIASAACDQSARPSSTPGATTAGEDPRDLTYAEWMKETEAGRGDSLARQLTEEEIGAISAGILSHKGDKAAVAAMTMRQLIERGRDVRRGSSGRGQ
jgi:hypothetical protein